MKYIITCPNCLYKLLKAAAGSDIEIKCPKCKILWKVMVQGKEIKIKTLQDVDEQGQ